MTWSDFIKTPYGVYIPGTHWENGDFSINTFRYIIDTKDKSPWAKHVFKVNAIALQSGCRWPDAAYALGYVTDDRPQTSVTRDSYVYCFCAAVFLDDRQWIEDIPIPFRLYRPPVWSWRNYLIKGEAKYRRRYEFWESISIRIALHKENGKIKWGLPEYAKRLSIYMARAANSQKILKIHGEGCF
jgi:hypothetical protein